MLELNAIFHRKENCILANDCVVEKIIPLSGSDFDRFSSNMIRDWDFIKDNADLMYVSRSGIYHCILVTGEGRENGILVESEGAGYARYAAHVPRVHSIIAAHNRSQALIALEQKLTAFVDHLADEYLNQLEHSDSASVYLPGKAIDFDIHMESGDTLWDAVTDMVGQRLREYDLDMEIDNGDLILTRGEPEMEMKM